MNTQNDPVRIIPPRKPPVAVGVEDFDSRRDNLDQCPHCKLWFVRDFIPIHDYTGHQIRNMF